MLLGKKLKLLLNYFVGPVILVWLIFSIYQQIQRRADIHHSWAFITSALVGSQAWKFWLVVVLMPLNWAIESRKWQLLIRHIQQLSFIRAYRAILFGQAIAFNTPNGVAAPVGRVIFLNEGNRLKGIALTIVGSCSQWLIVFIAGFAGLLYLYEDLPAATNSLASLPVFWYKIFVWLTLFNSCVLLLLYYRLSWVIKWLEKIPFIAKYKFLVEDLENFGWRELTRILLFSASRYVITLFQYVLLLQVFKVEVSVMEIFCIMGVLLLILTIIPSIALVELGFRGKIGLVLFGLYSTNQVGIIASIGSVWIINALTPAIVGSLVMLGVKLFKKKSNQ